MPINELDNYNKNTFDSIKHIDEFGNEYWEARELQKVLEYVDWRKFESVIKKAIISLETEGSRREDWVVEAGKPIITGKGKKEKINDYKLSRYICYLIVQNADPRKKVIALGQKYFAVQTRKQELTQWCDELVEIDKRLYNRKLTKKKNKELSQVAKKVGVKNFDKFHNYGYKGLYNGETANDIARRKDLRYREDILDNMGSDELIANLFRISQTEQKLKNENIITEGEANMTHFKIGRNIRKVIQKNGGTMPEDLPTPQRSLKELENEGKRRLLPKK